MTARHLLCAPVTLVSARVGRDFFAACPFAPASTPQLQAAACGTIRVPVFGAEVGPTPKDPRKTAGPAAAAFANAAAPVEASS